MYVKDLERKMVIIKLSLFWFSLDSFINYFGLSSPAVFPQIFLIRFWFYKALISIGGTTSLGAFCHFIRKLCAPSIINNLYLSRIIISIKDSFHFNNIWFRTLLEKSVKTHCCMKCPQILREKTSSQKSHGIALRIQWHFFHQN